MIDLSQVTDIMLGNETVTQIEDSLGNVLWSAAPPTPTAEYFYIENVSNDTATVSFNEGADSTISIKVSTDMSNWDDLGLITNRPTYSLPAGDKLYISATGDTWNFASIKCNKSFNVGGYLMSLLKGDNFLTNNYFNNENNAQFGGALGGNSTLISANNLLMPTNTDNSCYQWMFSGCTSLTTAPVLPVTTLAAGCYSNMFNGCTSLTTAPVLPATTLANGCYNSMFDGCTGLTTPPALPATTLAGNCYQRMFQNCTSLTTAPAILPATTMVPECYSYMFYGCTSLTTAPELPSTDSNYDRTTRCYEGMFIGCTSLTTAPTISLLGTGYATLRGMFSGCSLLNRVTIYTPYSGGTSFDGWLENVAATGDFYNLSSTTYPSGASGIPSGWTVHTSL